MESRLRPSDTPCAHEPNGFIATALDAENGQAQALNVKTDGKQFSVNRVAAAAGDGDVPAGRQITLDWIAQRLQMGCRHTLADRLKAMMTHP